MLNFFKKKHSTETDGFCDLDAQETLCLYETQKTAYVWLDVRTSEEWKEGHIPHAKHIPIDDIENRLSEVGSPNQKYIVYCHSGGRSAKVCEFLVEKGFKNIINYSGGMSHWTGPTEK